MTTLASRLKQARKDAGLTQLELAKAVGIQQPVISQIEKGQNQQSAHIAQLAHACGVRALWLAEGLEPKRIDDSERADGDASQHANVSPTLQPHRSVKEYPLISWVAAGSWAESCDNYQPGDGDELIASDENAGDCGYWLEVKGKSMFDPSANAPATFPPKHRILVQPEGFDVISGKFYIARLREPGGKWETTFKQYVRDAGVEYLQPLNPSYEVMKIDENVEIIGRVIDARPPRSVF